jgi:hypothetical protein
MIKKFNVSVPHTYQKDGEERTFWANVGKLTYFPKTETKEAGFALELYMFPNTKFGVFADEPREQRAAQDDMPL